MNKDNRKVVVEELISLISKGNAHASFEDAVAGVSMDLLTVVPDRLPYNIWQLAEHIRIAQWDIVEFCLDPNHKSPKWPDEYWPSADSKADKKKWEATLAGISKDRERFFDLLRDERRDLYETFSYGDGQCIFREALLLADHTAYHTGEIIVIRRLLNDWKS
ncbi:MAG TPA: DinB family protein [Pedobacter sp.]|jgi:hypothetical protein